MAKQFNNQPNLRLHGSAWDPPHLDSLLQSDWGHKLFTPVAAVPRPARVSLYGSWEFRASPRSTEPPSALPSHIRTQSQGLPDPPELPQLGQQLQQLSRQIASTLEDVGTPMSAPRRRSVHTRLKLQYDAYETLKQTRFSLLKTQRLATANGRSEFRGESERDRTRRNRSV